MFVVGWLRVHANDCQANRTLEDVDAYYRTNPPLIVVCDPDAVSAKRPLKYIQHEDEEIQRKAKGQGQKEMHGTAYVEHIQ